MARALCLRLNIEQLRARFMDDPVVEKNELLRWGC